MSLNLTELLQLFRGTEVEKAIQKMWDDLPNKEVITQEATKGEANKLHPLRLANGFYEKYAPDHLSGIDIGCGFSPINETFRRYDYLLGDGDATTMADISDNKFHTVHASHILEHIEDVKSAIRNWFRITRSTGHLIIVVPHQQLYEKKKTLPSQFNPDHKWFWLPDTFDGDCILSLKHTVCEALTNFEIVSLLTYDSGYVDTGDLNHPDGNYSIEIIIKKL